jgi:hypothetical protein
MSVEQFSRYEMKYAVRPEQLPYLESAIGRYCALDGFHPLAGKSTYTVDTLYFDSPDWRIFRAAENQEAARTKLRVRTYPDTPNAPAKIEVKRRVKDKILKIGAVVPLGQWQQQLLRTEPLLSQSSATRRAIEEFITLQRLLDASPRMMIRYQRRAYSSRIDDYVRITFDSRIRFQPQTRYVLSGNAMRWQFTDDEESIGLRGDLLMELKFKERPPLWIADIIRSMGLVRQGYSKYCSAVRHCRYDWPRFWDLAQAAEALRV